MPLAFDKTWNQHAKVIVIELLYECRDFTQIKLRKFLNGNKHIINFTVDWPPIDRKAKSTRRLMQHFYGQLFKKEIKNSFEKNKRSLLYINKDFFYFFYFFSPLEF